MTVKHLLNGGYAGRNQESIQAHIDELAALGVPGRKVTPTMYPVAPYLAQQTDTVPVQHSRTSGEVEWALIIADDGRQLLTLASTTPTATSGWPGSPGRRTPPPTCSARTPGC